MNESANSPSTPLARTVPEVNLWIPIGLLVGIVLAVASALGAAAGLTSGWPQPESARPRQMEAVKRRYEFPPAAPLSFSQRIDRQAYEARQSEILTTYGWIDQEDGIARIPLERAMQLLIESNGNNP